MTLSWSAAWRIARRDLHRQFRGLRLLLVCLFLGVGALAAIGSLTGAIRGELAAQGRTILGGDLAVQLYQRPLGKKEVAFLSRYGTLSPGLRMQAMASAHDTSAPIELKAVASSWPLYGALTLQNGQKVGAPQPGEAWIAPDIAARLDVAPGERITIGRASVLVAGIIASEPDRLSEGFTLGQAVIVPYALPARAGLTAPGALYRSSTRVRFNHDYNPESVSQKLLAAFPDAGLKVRTRNNASPGAQRFIGRMGEFLTLVGLAALAIAGIGIGGGVSSYLQARRQSIATLKILGATSSDIVRIYSLQIGTAALAGSVAGVIAGVLVTPLLAGALGNLLPVATSLTLDPLALLRAAAFGLLVAFVFAAPPLLRARDFPAMALMRSRIAPIAMRWRTAILPVGLGLGGIALLALAGSDKPDLAAMFLGGAAAMLALLALLGLAIRAGAAKLPRPASPIWRTALANLHRPGASTGALVTALGFGLAAFVLLAAVQTSINGNISRTVPQRAPDYFVLDLPQDGAPQFTSLIEKAAPGSKIETTPIMRGRVLAYGNPGNPVIVRKLKKIPDGAWALRGERGLTYADAVPKGNTLTAGKWWPRGYSGPPLVSVDAKLARVLGLKLGDIIRVGVYGKQVTARIASLRRIDWDSLGFNYVFIFSPDALQAIPHDLAATVKFPGSSPPPGILRQLVQAFPSSSVIEVGPILTQARTILNQVGLAVLAAASVAVLAGIAVLLGAIAAARAARTYDTVILRVLGASRKQLLGAQLAEFGLLTALLAVVALGIGIGLGWLVITQLFGFDWLPDWPRILAVLGSGLVLVLGFALAASLPLLRAKPARTLRSL